MKALLARYARRMTIEQRLAEIIRAFHLDRGALQNGTVTTLAKDSVTTGLPARWAFKDE